MKDKTWISGYLIKLKCNQSAKNERALRTFLFLLYFIAGSIGEWELKKKNGPTGTKKKCTRGK